MNEQGRLSAAVIGLAVAAALMAPPAHAQSGAKPQTQEASIEGVSAEIVDAVRKEGVLTLKVRYRNSGSAPAIVHIFDYGDTAKYYVTSGSTKFLVLKDSANAALALNNGAHVKAEIKPNASFLFWAKYPAPPAEAKKINFYNPHTPPFEDVPITEAK